MREKTKRCYSSRRITQLLIMISIICFCTLLGSKTLLVKANEPNQSAQKYFKSIQIEDGDTLYSIASEHMCNQYRSTSHFVYELQNVNHLSDDTLNVGNYLIVPYYQ